MLTQGLDTQALGGVVAGSEIIQTQFPRQMGGLFRNLPAQIGIHPQGRHLGDEALRGARAPGDGRQRGTATRDTQGDPAQGRRHPEGEGLALQMLW